MPDTQKDVARLDDFVCIGETPLDGELFELAPDIVKIQITDDDIIDYCQRLKDLNPEEIGTLSQAIKARDLMPLSPDNYAFAQVTAMYVKHYRKEDFLRLVEISLYLDKGDMSYLESIGLPSNECILKDNVSVMLVRNEKATDFVQGILSEDLRPQTRVDKTLQDELKGKLMAMAHIPAYDAIFWLSMRNTDERNNTKEQAENACEMSPSERRRVRKSKENGTENNPANDKITALAKKDWYNFQLVLRNGIDGKAWRPSVKKMMMYVSYKLTQQNNFPAGWKQEEINRYVSFSYDEWLTVTGKKNTKIDIDNFRKDASQDCDVIANTAIRWEEPRDKKKSKVKDWGLINLVTLAEAKKGRITIAISPEIAACLLNGYITKFPIGLLSVDERNASTFSMGQKLSEHYYNNINKRNKRNDILSVERLLDCSDYPSKEEVKEKHASKYRVYIIEPFIKAMEELSKKTGMKWKFCNAGKTPLTEKQHPEKDIDDFLKMYISFQFNDNATSEKALLQQDSATSGELEK